MLIGGGGGGANSLITNLYLQKYPDVLPQRGAVREVTDSDRDSPKVPSLVGLRGDPGTEGAFPRSRQHLPTDNNRRKIGREE